MPTIFLRLDVHERDFVRVAIDDHDDRRRVGDLDVGGACVGAVARHGDERGSRQGQESCCSLHNSPPVTANLESGLEPNTRHEIPHALRAFRLLERMGQMEREPQFL